LIPYKANDELAVKEPVEAVKVIVEMAEVDRQPPL
jgi:hypothetical protein